MASTRQSTDAVGLGADRLLADAALGYRRWLPGKAGTELAGSLARKPATVARRGRDLAVELGQVVAGQAATAPDRADRRFADPAWQGNFLLRRSMQAYLATSRAATDLIDAAELDWRSDERIRFIADNVIACLAPTNNPLLNPAALKTAIDTGGESFARGARAFVRDMSVPPRLPRMVEPDDFAVGQDLACTPGTVVLRTEQFELLQYTPQTETVRTVPLLLVPALINKYYAMDLAPGRSLVEHLVQSGQQVFVMSWRNPDERHRDWGLDTYAKAVLEALDAVEQICEVESTMVCGFCSGGILASMVVAHLAAKDQLHRIAGLTLPVTLIDQSNAGALIDPATANLAIKISARKGYLAGSALAEVFAWVRPGDLVWNYWTNNYLLGQRPPVFDILFWNADTTRMPAALHRDFIDVGLGNKVVAGTAAVLGTVSDLSKITVDAYVVAAVADHLCRWESCYRTTGLLGGKTRFVLSNSGHIAAIVNPPSNAKATYQVSDETPNDPQEWLGVAETRQGSWWEDYVGWLGERCGPEIAASDNPGANGFAPVMAAPGTYIFER